MGCYLLKGLVKLIEKVFKNIGFDYCGFSDGGICIADFGRK